MEATSVTPFSPRALDRGLAGTLVALARQGHPPMTPPKGAGAILRERPQLAFVVSALAERAASHAKLDPADAARLKQRVQERAADLLDEWSKTAQELQAANAELQYQVEAGAAQRLLYEFLHPDVKRLPPTNKKLKFRANRSLRDVEPSVNLWVRTLDNVEIEEDEV